jgi:hypothetical protein
VLDDCRQNAAVRVIVVTDAAAAANTDASSSKVSAVGSWILEAETGLNGLAEADFLVFFGNRVYRHAFHPCWIVGL